MPGFQTAIIEKPRVLVVDDESSIRELLTELLQFEGYTVLSAHSGELALQTLESGPVDVMLTDLKMPGMGGLELLGRAREVCADMVAVMMTGFGTVEAAVTAMKHGAFDFLLKPFEPEAVLVVVRKALSQLRLRRENSELREELNLYQLSEAIAGNMPLDKKLSTVAELVQENFGVEGVSIVTQERSGNAPFVTRHQSGQSPKLQWPALFDAHRRGESVLGSGTEFALDQEPASFASVPMKVGGNLIGMLSVHHRDSEDAISASQYRALSVYSGRAAEAIEADRAQRALKETFTETIEGFARALEAKDTYTAGHSDRVAEYSALIACEMGLEMPEIDRVRHGGLLHDIGKIGIRSTELNKPQKLAPDEYLMFQSHPVIGRRIIEPISFLVYLVPCVYHHHESFDGSGYPERLSGEDIPLEARILSVADSYDAMTTDRPYRKALPHDIALKELKRCADRQFDPRVVDAFLAAIEQHRRACIEAGIPVPH